MALFVFRVSGFARTVRATDESILHMKWLGNIRVPPQTMRDLTDKEWLDNLRAEYGENRVHIGECQEGGGHTAAYWEAKGMCGLYLDEE